MRCAPLLNQIILMGRLVADPELKTTSSNIPVCGFRIAVDRDYQRQGEEKQTDYIDIVAWRSTAEFVSRYFSKGRMIIVHGSLQSRKWQDKDGNNRIAWEVQADKVYFGDSKKEASGGDQTEPGATAPATDPADPEQDFVPLSDDDLLF